MSKRWLRKTGLAGTFVVPALLVVFLLVQMSGISRATDVYDPDPSGEEETYDTSADAPPTKEWQHRNFFEPYPMGEGGKHYDDMTAEEQVTFDSAKEHYDTNAEQIAQAYSQGTRARAEYAKLRMAEREAGLQNIADVGVE